MNPRVAGPLRGNRPLQVMVLGYLAVWTLAAIGPHDRGDWLLENLLVFGLAGLVTAAHQRFPFSNLSYPLLLSFLSLHAVGARYTYSLTPPGF